MKANLCLLICEIDPFQCFFSAFNVYQLGKICRHHWKESLNFSKFAKFDKVFDKAPQSREILQTLLLGRHN